jgi:riboflavin synthase
LKFEVERVAIKPQTTSLQLQSIMFTGIIERTAKVLSATDGAMFRRLVIAADWTDVKPGQSIAVNGVCLTVADLSSGRVGFDVIKETLDKTNLGTLKAGDEVNVERSLRAGDRIDGHFVQGHVDGTGALANLIRSENEVRLTIEAPKELARYLSPKGSVSVDGVSLTIAAVKGNVFDVALIPMTLKLTTLGARKLGWRFNLEADILSKTVVNYLEQRGV